MRLRFKRPSGSLVTLQNSTTFTVTHGTNVRSLIHKDNAGSHDEVTADGLNSSSTCNFFFEDASTYAALAAAWNAEEELELEWFDNVTAATGLEKYAQKGIITSLSKTATVRESVTGTVNFQHSGDLTISTVT